MFICALPRLIVMPGSFADKSLALYNATLVRFKRTRTVETFHQTTVSAENVQSITQKLEYIFRYFASPYKLRFNYRANFFLRPLLLLLSCPPVSEKFTMA